MHSFPRSADLMCVGGRTHTAGLCQTPKTLPICSRAMIKSARLATSCLLLAATSVSMRAATADDSAPIVIQRAPEGPEPVQAAPAEELTALRNENQRLSKELTKAREVLERLQADAITMASERAKETAAVEQNAREVAELRTQVTQPGAAIPAAGPSTAVGDEALLKKYETVQAAARSLEAKNEMLTSTLSAANARIAELSAAKPDQDLNAQLAAQKARADEATTRLNTIVMGVDNLNAEKGLLEAQLADLRRNEANLREQLAAAKSASPSATSPDLSGKLAETEAKLATSERNLAALKAENDLLKTAGADNARLTAELQSLRQEKAASDTKSPQLEAKLADIEGKLSTTLRSYSLIQAENDQLKKAAAERSQQADELAALRKQNSELEARLATPPPPAGPTDAEKKLETVLRSFTQVQAENEQLKQAAAGHASQSTELENLRKQNSELEARLAASSAAPAAAPTPEPSVPAQPSDAEKKLSTVLRSYSLLQAENEHLKSEAAQNVQSAQATAAKSAADSATQMSALFDELRQTKASLTAFASENSQLKTRLALVGSPPGSTLASPSRPGSIAAVAATAPSAPTAPAVVPAGERQHVVTLGDTLAKISRQYYGSPNRWEDILRANADVVKDANALAVGTTLRIP